MPNKGCAVGAPDKCYLKLQYLLFDPGIFNAFIDIRVEVSVMLCWILCAVAQCGYWQLI